MFKKNTFLLPRRCWSAQAGHGNSPGFRGDRDRAAGQGAEGLPVLRGHPPGDMAFPTVKGLGHPIEPEYFGAF